MNKTILITGATDGIGLAAAKQIAAAGHSLLIHGRNPEKLQAAKAELSALSNSSQIETYIADLSVLSQVEELAQQIKAKHQHLDALINNAGIFRTNNTVTPDGLDVRFAVNTIAPFLLTQRLLPLLKDSARVINLSSAAQAPVNLEALSGSARVPDMEAYSQSKLALTMWSHFLASQIPETVFVAINPGSLLATKMVKEGFGVSGKDIGIGANILVHAALSEEFSTASGKYFDNDIGRFSKPHPDGENTSKCEAVVEAINSVLKNQP
ncbi:SDR family NAD(P)-dependent oxidoreductase [Pelagicoccus mobilis]|uniref:SDR family NAD(P)-dependent oxidoreductase n=1 Tax=Pelagicoccus mobilis TaxID=415221 RepID=A0A934VNM6_9BACT|nr:SDR family NAD(P)-dependent oxidoreductase [Pelagicoccus mobilis]MBK1880116.1 SDR family NAD(P)-dependent oxidoreductase [Pelagicoccus mobilis]